MPNEEMREIEEAYLALLKDAFLVASAWESAALEEEAYAQVTAAAVRIIERGITTDGL